MTIRKFQPSGTLAPYISEYLLIESDADILNQTIPGTSLVLSFRFSGRIVQESDGKSEVLPGSVISGLRKNARGFRYEKGTFNLLAVFREGAIHAFTRVPAHELFGLSVDTQDIFPSAEISALQERLAEAPGHPQRLLLLEAFLLRQLTPIPQDGLILEAASLIKRQNGNLRIKSLAEALHISQDPLEKRFRARIGATPKQYAALVRLNALVGRYHDTESLTQAAYEAGYFDQSHFIRDFRQFTGQTPKAYFSVARGW
ncbi:helix-turn-helix transcriptional regulator [Chitinophaga rhizosphaerae]|uniref:helix-turn-helix transcriptional regulator n=1 Tax=Chitinophaga rhizosphaerae TaxID=1864947 RepID=UPI000F8085CF|nr:helix-turn-helix transcriptional regulator [Chitinophaga rhizosphaerae]